MSKYYAIQRMSDGKFLSHIAWGHMPVQMTYSEELEPTGLIKDRSLAKVILDHCVSDCPVPASFKIVDAQIVNCGITIDPNSSSTHVYVRHDTCVKCEFCEECTARPWEDDCKISKYADFIDTTTVDIDEIHQIVSTKCEAYMYDYGDYPTYLKLPDWIYNFLDTHHAEIVANSNVPGSKRFHNLIMLPTRSIYNLSDIEVF